MSEELKMVRRTLEFSEAANAKLKTLPKELGIKQPELLSLLLEHATAEDEYLVEGAKQIRESNEARKEKRQKLMQQLESLDEDKLEALLKKAES